MEAPVDSTALRAAQQPLKDAYRKDPREAVVTLRARGELGEEGISCSVATGQALAGAGPRPPPAPDRGLGRFLGKLVAAHVGRAAVLAPRPATALPLTRTPADAFRLGR